VKTLIYFLIFAALLSLIIFFAPNFIRISQIGCMSQYGPCNPTLVSRLENLTGKKLKEAKEEIKNILSSEILVSDYLIQFKLPNSLEVSMVERKPIYSLTKQGASAYAQVDESGLVIRIDDKTPLPRLFTTGQIPNVGDRVDQKHLFALTILYRMFAFYQVQEGNMEESYMETKLKNGPKVIFPLEGDEDILIASLQLILARLNRESEGIRINENDIELSMITSIDLRYKNPVVR